MSNRIPAPNAKFRACLVSLEERTDLVQANPPPVADPIFIGIIDTREYGKSNRSAANLCHCRNYQDPASTPAPRPATTVSQHGLRNLSADARSTPTKSTVLATVPDRNVLSAVGFSVPAFLSRLRRDQATCVLLHSWTFECTGVGHLPRLRAAHQRLDHGNRRGAGPPARHRHRPHPHHRDGSRRRTGKCLVSRPLRSHAAHPRSAHLSQRRPVPPGDARNRRRRHQLRRGLRVRTPDGRRRSAPGARAHALASRALPPISPHRLARSRFRPRSPSARHSTFTSPSSRSSPPTLPGASSPASAQSATNMASRRSAVRRASIRPNFNRLGTSAASPKPRPSLAANLAPPAQS